MLLEHLDGLGVDSIWIHARTKARDRATAYRQCQAGEVVLITIKVINEGVDFPWLVRLIDARPTLSPVSWLQTIGRIMRPGAPKHYICTNRNLERHAYLMQGAVPRTAIAAAQEEWEKPSKRAGLRQIGLEALRRFKAIALPLHGGATGSMYCVHAIDEQGLKTEYVTLLDPTHDRPFVARRSVAALEEGEERRSKKHYGRWALCEIPLDFTGFSTSSATGKLSEKQRTWWERDAKRVGLSELAAEEITRRQFQALPVLVDCKRNMIGGPA